MFPLQNLPSNINYLSPDLDLHFFNFPDVNDVQYSLSIGGIDVEPLRNIQNLGDEVSFEELTIQFVVDENMKNWIIYDWIISTPPTQELKYKLDQDEKNPRLQH